MPNPEAVLGRQDQPEVRGNLAGATALLQEVTAGDSHELMLGDTPRVHELEEQVADLSSKQKAAFNQAAVENAAVRPQPTPESRN